MNELQELVEKKEVPTVQAEISSGVEENATLGVSSEDVLAAWSEGYGKSRSVEGEEKFCSLLVKYFEQETKKHACYNQYNVIVLFDNTILVKADSDKIYKAIREIQDKKKPLLLMIVSRGGEPGSAYLIGKLCQELCGEKFIVVIPRHAKSAATLLSCAASEIHMGSMSELGPIDPQMDGMPALALKNSIEHIAELVSKFPKAAEMFAKYLSLSTEPIQIGYYERTAESASQYAEKLLSVNVSKLPNSPRDIAQKLVLGYKDHGFVIDKAEAVNIFGSEVIKSNTPEYDLVNDLYSILSKINDKANSSGYSFYFIGGLNSKPTFIKQK